MKYHNPIRICTILVLSVVVVAATVPQSGRSWMNGFILDGSPTKGLTGAMVELIGSKDNERLRSVKLSTTADSDGRYELKDIPYGEYTFRVSKDGYATYEIELYVAPDMLTSIHVNMRKK